MSVSTASIRSMPLAELDCQYACERSEQVIHPWLLDAEL